MYLRTPKRYTRGQRRSPISLRWLWLWLLTPVVVFAGIKLYENRDIISPPIQEAISGIVDSAQDTLATANAPTPMPTQDPTERLMRANENWEAGRIETAINDYEAIIDATPNMVQPYYRLALGLLMEGRLQEGLEMAERTVTADPFSADAWAIRSMALDWNSRYGEAIASALRALELDPDSARAMAFLAQAYLDNGDITRAREYARRAIETNPNGYEGYRVRAQIYQTADYDFAAARADFQMAYDLAPNFPQQAIDLSQVLITANGVDLDYDTPIAMLQDVIELNPQNSRVLYWLGSYYYSGMGDPQQAREYLGRCVESNPTSAACQGLLGRVQMALNDNVSAVESLRKAVELGTPNPRHYLWLGRAYIAMGNCPEAVPYLQQAYDMGLEIDEEAATAAAENLAECQAPVPGLIDVTQEVTPDGDES